jgi:hypothetical protein
VAVTAGATRLVYGAATAVRATVAPAQAGVAVELRATTKGGASDEVVATGTTGADGVFTASVTPRANTTYVARADGATSLPLGIQVSPRVKASARRSTVRKGRRRVVITRVTGQVSPTSPAAVVLERVAGRRPVVVARGRVSGGRFALTARSLPPGKYRVRVIAPRGILAAGLSNLIRVR